MKHILLYIIAFNSAFLHAQSLKWDSFDKDDYFHYELPKGVIKNSAKNQTIYSSKGKYCIFMVSIIRQPGIRTSAPYQINGFYKGVLKTVASPPNVVSDSLMMFRGFLADRITVRTNSASDTQTTEGTFVLVKDVSYVFSITFFESNREKSRSERDQFVSSIRAVSGHPYGYQYTHFDESYETGERIGRMARYAFLLLIVAAIVLIVLKKWKVASVIKNIAGIFCLIFSVFQLLGSFGASTPESRYWLLAFSVVACGIGIGALIVKVPTSRKN